MSLSINKLFFVFIIIFLFIEDSYSQCLKSGVSRGARSALSIELGAGIPIPFTPSNNLKFGDSQKLEFGIRYLPEESNFGLRGYFSYAVFSDSIAELTNNENKLKISRLELQGIYMLDNLLGISRRSFFELESYIGFGAALGKSSSNPNSNKILTTTIGLRPRFLIDKRRLYVYLDTSFGMLRNQKYDYSGVFIPRAKEKKLDTALHLSVGLSYKL